jgi:hypothetical protein
MSGVTLFWNAYRFVRLFRIYTSHEQQSILDDMRKERILYSIVKCISDYRRGSDW